MTELNQADLVASAERKPSRKWPDEQKLQRRREMYAAMGPSCPNGHSWSEQAKFNYRGFRFCMACTEAKANARRTDPATYIGACPQGHAYTRQNTIITNWNAKICATCKDIAAREKVRMVSPEKMKIIIAKARAGLTSNEICCRTPSLRGRTEGQKVIISVNTLHKLANLPTAQCRKLKALLANNTFRGRRDYRWNEKSRGFLAEEVAKSRPFQAITHRLNEKFGADFTLGAVRTMAAKRGLIRPIRTLIVPRCRSSAGMLLDRISHAVPSHLAGDHRDDVISDMSLAVYEGRLEEQDIERRVCEFVNSGYRRDHDRFGPLSLDVPLFEGSGLRRIDLITENVWQHG